VASGGEAVALSDDHKPDNAEEKERVLAAGGEVKFGRVNGDLAVSRAVGDFVYKRCGTHAGDSHAMRCAV
jgi:protein phosphatase 2C family protein 2/3